MKLIKLGRWSVGDLDEKKIEIDIETETTRYKHICNLRVYPREGDGHLVEIQRWESSYMEDNTVYFPQAALAQKVFDRIEKHPDPSKADFLCVFRE